jgi:hypothetical protein
MRGYTLFRLVTTIAIAMIVAGVVYVTHPDWFRNRSSYSLPVVDQGTPTAGATVPSAPTRIRPKPQPTATVPSINMTLHLDDIWITPFRIEYSRGGNGLTPNLNDSFLVAYLSIANRSQVDYPVRTSDFQVLDSHGALDSPIPEDFTHLRLREVRLIPHGYIRGTLVFEVPLHDPTVRLIYQPDPIDPTKQKIWVLR